MVCEDITVAARECGGSIAAFVVMPDHLHLLVFLPEHGLLHKFNKLPSGEAGRQKSLSSFGAATGSILLLKSFCVFPCVRPLIWRAAH